MMLEVRDQLNFDRGVLQGCAEGVELGHKAGLAEGEERLSRLIAELIKDGKTDEVDQALLDRQTRTELYRTYGMA